jgi:hypothetical protein
MPLTRRILRDMAAGVKWGLIMASILSLWVIVLIPFTDNLVIRDRTGDGYHVVTVIALYFGGGICVGTLVGALRPLMRSRVGAAAVGAIAMLPLGAALVASRIGFRGWTHEETVVLLVMTFAFGAPGGVILRAFIREKQRHGKEGRRKRDEQLP